MNIDEFLYAVNAKKGSAVTGWLTNLDEIVICARLYEHVDQIRKFVSDNLKYPELDGFVFDSWQNVANAEQSCQDLADEGEHPEWHHYEMTQSSEEYRIIKKVYASDWLRIYYKDGTLTIEGKDTACKNKYAYLQRIQRAIEGEPGLADEVAIQFTKR